MKLKTESEIVKFIGSKRINYDALKKIDLRVFWKLIKNGIINFDEKTRTYGVK